MIRVLYVMHTAAQGGAGLSLFYLLRSLPPGTVEPVVAGPPGPALERLRRSNIPVHELPSLAFLQSIAGAPLRGRRLVLHGLRALADARHGRLFRRLLDTVRPDVVHVNDRGLIQAAALARRAGVPVVMHVRCVAERRSGVVSALLDHLTRRDASRVVAIDESVRASLRGIPSVEVIYNPLGNSADAPAIRRAAPGPRRVTFIGNLLPYKGIWDLLEAALLLRDRRDIVFRLVGGNSRPAAFFRTPAGWVARLGGLAGDVESAVRDFVRRHGLDTQVTIAGHVDEVAAELDQTDILAFPSRLNGVGRSVFEAGVRGIPSIVALANRVEDVVIDGVTGLIVPERDPPAIAAAIRRLVDDEGFRARLGAEARRRYLEQFDPARIGARMVDVYRGVLAGNVVKQELYAHPKHQLQ